MIMINSKGTIYYLSSICLLGCSVGVLDLLLKNNNEMVCTILSQELIEPN